MLDEGQLPFRKVGSHRRVLYEDLRAYIEKEKEARRKTLTELAAYDDEIGLDNSDPKCFRAKHGRELGTSPK